MTDDRTALQVQILELQRLLDGLDDDPILGPQLRQRLEEASQKLDAARRVPESILPRETIVPPRAAIFLSGADGIANGGIRPSLAGEALVQYEKMFTAQAIHDERLAARQTGRKRRPQGASTPALYFVGTPRGSFGLEFVPQVTDTSLVKVHSESLHSVAETLISVTQSRAESLAETVKNIPVGVLQPLKKFLSVLRTHHAEVRFAFHDRDSATVNASEIASAAERLNRDVQQDEVTIRGKFRGLTLDSGYFDFHAADGEDITGTVADHLDEDDLNEFSSFVNRQCEAIIERTIVTQVGTSASQSYVLIDVKPEYGGK